MFVDPVEILDQVIEDLARTTDLLDIIDMICDAQQAELNWEPEVNEKYVWGYVYPYPGKQKLADWYESLLGYLANPFRCVPYLIRPVFNGTQKNNFILIGYQHDIDMLAKLFNFVCERIRYKILLKTSARVRAGLTNKGYSYSYACEFMQELHEQLDQQNYLMQLHTVRPITPYLKVKARAMAEKFPKVRPVTSFEPA